MPRQAPRLPGRSRLRSPAHLCAVSPVALPRRAP